MVSNFKYLDVIRIIDKNDLNRFEQLAAKVDLNALQSGVSPMAINLFVITKIKTCLFKLKNKPFIFHAIQKNDLTLVRILLEQEIDLNQKYKVRKFFFVKLKLKQVAKFLHKRLI